MSLGRRLLVLPFRQSTKALLCRRVVACAGAFEDNQKLCFCARCLSSDAHFDRLRFRPEGHLGDNMLTMLQQQVHMTNGPRQTTVHAMIQATSKTVAHQRLIIEPLACRFVVVRDGCMLAPDNLLLRAEASDAQASAHP